MTINKKKYENLILALCRGAGGSISGKKKFAKLLYFVDFDNFEYKESMKSVTGDIYRALPMGPVPNAFMTIVSTLESKGLLKHETKKLGVGYRDCEVFEALAEPDMSCFTDEERSIVDRVIRKYVNLSGGQLEILSHEEAPWLGTNPYEEIIYELAFYRGTDFSDVLATTC